VKIRIILYAENIKDRHGRKKNREIGEKIMEKDEKGKKRVFVRNR
jgi:hypothetical protein